MRIKKKALRKRLPQLPINFPAPIVIPFDYEKEKDRVECLCKRLADNEVEVRDLVLAQLPRYIKEVCSSYCDDDSNTTEGQAVEADDGSKGDEGEKQKQASAELDLLFDKLCLGIFFCFWHSDKPLVQHECAAKIVQLLHTPPTYELRRKFLKSMFAALVREWGKIDKWRVDKYLSLVRELVREAIVDCMGAVAEPKKQNARKGAAKKRRVEEEGDAPTEQEQRGQAHVSGVCEIFRKVVTCGNAVGLAMQLCDVFLDELIRAECPRALFEILARDVVCYAISQDNFLEKRVIDFFIIPIAAGTLESALSEEDAALIAEHLAASLKELSVGRGTARSARPACSEAQHILEEYVSRKKHPALYSTLSITDEQEMVRRAIVRADKQRLEDLRAPTVRSTRKGVVPKARKGARGDVGETGTSKKTKRRREMDEIANAESDDNSD